MKKKTLEGSLHEEASCKDLEALCESLTVRFSSLSHHPLVCVYGNGFPPGRPLRLPPWAEAQVDKYERLAAAVLKRLAENLSKSCEAFKNLLLSGPALTALQAAGALSALDAQAMAWKKARRPLYYRDCLKAGGAAPERSYARRFLELSETARQSGAPAFTAWALAQTAVRLSQWENDLEKEASDRDRKLWDLAKADVPALDERDCPDPECVSSRGIRGVARAGDILLVSGWWYEDSVLWLTDDRIPGHGVFELTTSAGRVVLDCVHREQMAAFEAAMRRCLYPGVLRRCARCLKEGEAFIADRSDPRILFDTGWAEEDRGERSRWETPFTVRPWAAYPQGGPWRRDCGLVEAALPILRSHGFTRMSDLLGLSLKEMAREAAAERSPFQEKGPLMD